MNPGPADGDNERHGGIASDAVPLESGDTAQDWLDPALARLAFGSSSSQSQSQSTATPDSGHLALDLPQMLELDLGDPQQREFGDYELREVIGRGGMGVVYRAHQRSLDRDVALKLLSAGLWASSEYVATLRREAQHAALLQHPNIVTVHEIGEHHGLIYYAMQLFDGNSLAARLRHDGPLAPLAAAILLRNVAEALDYAHRLGVLHLDLKPGNVLLDADDVPRIADFGLARRVGASGDADNERVSGTPSYMAPEQTRVGTSNLSRATDVWGLGALLYEMLTGRPPFEGAQPREVLAKVEHAPPQPPRELCRHLSPDLEAICLRCLDKSPALRYPTARALADDLGRFIDGRPVSVRPLNVAQRLTRWARREPRLALTGGLAALALVIGLAATTAQWRRAEYSALVSRERLWDSRHETVLRLERDGHGWLALSPLLANINEEQRSGRGDLAQLERRRIGTLLQQGAVLIDRMAIADAQPLVVELSDDGKLLAIAFNDQSVRWYDPASLRELGRTSLAGLPTSDGQARVPLLLHFVDRHRLVVTLDWLSNLAAPFHGDSWLVDLDHGRVIRPPPPFARFADATYSDDGRFALLRDRDNHIQCWQVDPWRACSPLVTRPLRDMQWLLGPDATFALMLNNSPRAFELYDPRDLAHPLATIAPPGNTGIAAWQVSHDGHWLALGDFEGRLYLFDLRTRAIQQLPAPRSREVTWLAFSEDDAWLAAVTWDGYAYAFDVASGNTLVAGQMQQDFAPHRVEVSHAQRLLMVSGGDAVYGPSSSDVALWRIPEPGARANPAIRIGLPPSGHVNAGRYPVGWSSTTGLLASAGVDGQLRLWRLPLSPQLHARAPNQLPEQLQFDGRHLVDVEWNRLRLVSPTGTALTPWLALPQPPGFAELVDDGRSLLVTLGPQLRVYAVPSLQLRYPPLPLPASPQRLLASDDGRRIVTTYGFSDATGFHERVLVHDTASGRRLPVQVVLPGPLQQLAFSTDHRRLLVVGGPSASSWVFDTDSLRKIGDFPHDEFQPVYAGAFADAGSPDVWLVTLADDPALGRNLLLRWNPQADVVRSQHGLGEVRPVMVLGTGPFVAGIEAELINPGGLHPRQPPRLASDEATQGAAASRDGHLYARAFRSSVQLIDAASGETLGPPLAADIPAMDTVQQLAFSPDGRQLVARTMYGHWLHWSITADLRPLPALDAELGRVGLHPTPPPLTVDEHARLRARDPGAWPAPQPRPLPPVARWIDGQPVPGRAPGTSPLMLDMTQVYGFAPDTIRNTYFSVLPSLRPRPFGVQRIGDTDFDLRGMSQLGTPASDAVGRLIPVPAVPVAAVHVLLTTSVPTPIAGEITVARIRLHYADGTQAILPIRTQREVPGYTGHDHPVPLAWAQLGAMPTLGAQALVLSAPRLPNPHPGKQVRALELEFGDGAAINSSLFMGITIEPVVIAGRDLRNSVQHGNTRSPPTRSAATVIHGRSP